MAFDLDMTGQTALVIGGSGGIGNAIAQAYRALGATVRVWGTRSAASDYADLADSDLTGLHYHSMDVSDFAAVADWQVPFARLDVLVQSQGIVMFGRQEFDLENFEKVLSVNLTSLMACANKFADMLVAARGSMIIVSSSAAFHAARGVPAYGTSKVGAMGLTRILAQTYAAKGVRVNGIAPGFVPTRLTANTVEDQARSETALARIPMGRFGTVKEMADIAVFLASPHASYVTGQTILADGGMLL